MSPPPLQSRDEKNPASQPHLIQGYPTILNTTGAQWKDAGLEEDGLKRGLSTYSEYELDGNGCLVGLR